MNAGPNGFSALVHGIAVSTQTALQAEWVAVLLPSDDSDWLVTAADTRPDAPFVRVRRHGHIGLWLRTEEAVLRASHPFLKDPTIQFDKSEVDLFGDTGARLAAPVLGGTSLAGMLIVGRPLGRSAYPVSHLNFAKSLADVAGLAITGHAASTHQTQPADDVVMRRMSHDVKGPLSTIMTYIDLVRQNKNGALGDSELKRLTKASMAGRRLLTLLNDFVDFARLRSGTLGLDRTEFDLGTMLTELADSFAPMLAQRGQQLRCTGPSEAVTVWADKSRLAQIVSTLLSNASRYSPEGVPLDLEASAEGARLKIRVTDRGRGMSGEQQRHVFEAFDPDKPSRRSEGDEADAGSGLGLVIARGLVKLHGGEIILQSSAGEGTVVSFEVPVILNGKSRSQEAA